MLPCVSVGLPVYNGEKFLAQAIQSILDQDFDDFELIISDNASTDKTEEICRTFSASDKRIRYLRNAQNIGAAANYNWTFQLCRGEFFKWCAHDDFVSRNFLREGVRALQSDTNAVVAYGMMEYVDADGKLIPRVDGMEPDVSVEEKTFPNMNELAASRRFQLLVDAGGSDNAMFGVMRRSALIKTSLHRKYYMSDRALLVELAMLGTFVRVPDIVLYNRDHSGRATRLEDKVDRSIWINPEIRNGRGFEHLNLLWHQMEIAYRYRHVAPLHQTLSHLVRWASQPFRLGGFALELVGFVSPTISRSLRRTGWRIINAARGPSGERAIGVGDPETKRSPPIRNA